MFQFQQQSSRRRKSSRLSLNGGGGSVAVAGASGSVSVAVHENKHADAEEETLIKIKMEEDKKMSTGVKRTSSSFYGGTIARSSSESMEFETAEKKKEINRRWSLLPPQQMSSSSSSSKQLQQLDLGCVPLSPPPKKKRRSSFFFHNNDKTIERNPHQPQQLHFDQFQQTHKNDVFNFEGEFYQTDEQKQRTRRKLKKYDNKRKKNKIEYFSTLPDEMLLRILKSLDKKSLGRVAQVSVRFSNLVRDESLWERIDCKETTFKSGRLDALLERKPLVLRLAMANIEKGNLVIATVTQKLTTLDLTMAILSEEVLSNLLSMCPQISKLSLEHLTVGRRVLRNLSGGKLTILNLAMCYGLDAGALATVLKGARKLQELNLGCVKVDWSEQDLHDVINSLPASLSQLNLAGFRNTLKDHHAQLLPIRTPDLIDLDLSDCQELTSKTITSSVIKLKELQHISFSRNYGIEPLAYSMLSCLGNLRYLEIFSLFKEASLENLSTGFKNKVKINKFPFSGVARQLGEF